MSSSAPVSSAAPAPSPTEFPAFLHHTTAALDRLTTHAADLPEKSDLAFHRTLDRKFAKNLDEAAERVLGLTEKLLSLVEVQAKGVKNPAAGKGVKSKARRKLTDEEDVLDGYRRGIVEVVDGLLEDADSKLDDLNGQKKKAAITVDAAALASAGHKLNGPFSRKNRERLPAHLMHAHEIDKPQLFFADVIDNSPSSSFWAPSLTSKPHAMVPLDFEPPLDDITDSDSSDPIYLASRRAAKIKRRRHPYWYETQHLPYPTSMFSITPPIPPASFEDTPFEFVDTPEKLDAMVERLKQTKEIAVDLEHHSTRSFAGFTCLMQISTRERDWIVDTLKLRSELREGKLGGVMVDPSIVKVFHGADSDIVWLQQDFDIYVVNLFDTFHATKVLNFQAHSLASLLSNYCNFTADKRYQMADWRIRPLGSEMLHYARADTHFLLYIYDNLRNTLLEKSSRPSSPAITRHITPLSDGEPTRRNPQKAMRNVLERSAETALKLYEREVYDPTGKGSGGWLAVARKWLPKGTLDEQPGWILRRLHAWRDNVAREEDESPIYVLSNDALKNLSLLRAANLQLVQRILSSKRMSAVNRTEEVTQVIANAVREFEGQQAGSSSTADQPAASDASMSAVATKSAVAAARAAAVVRARLEHTEPKSSQMSSASKAASDDVWSRLTQPSPKPASKLFGSTIKTNASFRASGSGSVTTKTSALFGKAMPGKVVQQGTGKAKKSSPGFEVVLRNIYADLAPSAATKAAEPSQVPNREETTINKLPQQETVPFVPSAARTTIQAPPQPGLPGASPAAQQMGIRGSIEEAGNEQGKKRKDEVLQVKRKKGKKRERANTTGDGNGTTPVVQDFRTPAGSEATSEAPSAAPPSTASSAVESPSVPPRAIPDASSHPAKKSKKERKVSPEDVPEFDYAKESNLLDNPTLMVKQAEQAHGKGKGKGKKDREKKPKAPGAMPAIETPKFGKKAARDMTQPRGGNRSGTFTQ